VSSKIGLFPTRNAQVDANNGLRSWKESLGLQIRDARKKAGFSSQAALGDALGLSRQMIQRYEAGDDAPSVDVLGRMALKLSMPEVNINGYRFEVTHSTASPEDRVPNQLHLEFDKEHVFPGATIKITPTSVSITITATAGVAS
jgi:transcriptional regulator with XRE-family HTH domain